jgi:transposase
VSGNAAEIARILEPHVARVVVVSPSDTGIRQARAKTDRLDARTLARLLAAGSLDAVWMADERTRVMRRRLARRAQLMGARSRCKNEIHAVLIRRLIARPHVSDLFGQAGRRWLSELELPVEERESVDAGMRLIEFLERKLADVDRLVALDALGWAQVKRLMSVPGVNVIRAASFLAAVGDIDRFKDPRKLVGYLGLDPKIRQSGPGPGTSGHISKQGSASARWALVESSWSAVRQPGPMRAFYQRVRARRGHQIAIVAAARKLACLFWFLLTREEDYAYAQPSLTKKKLRRLEIAAGAPKYQGRSNIWSTNDAMREAERALAEQAELAYRNTVRDWHAAQANKTTAKEPGAGGRDTGARIKQAQTGQSRAADHKPLTSALRYVSHSRPHALSHQPAIGATRLDFIRRAMRQPAQVAISAATSACLSHSSQRTRLPGRTPALALGRRRRQHERLAMLDGLDRRHTSRLSPSSST